MSGGINFGSLTIFINGSAVNLKDYDKDGDGKLQGDELRDLLSKFQLDTYNMQTLDKNGDEEISADEFIFWGQRLLMDDAVKQLIENRISMDFIGQYAQYQPQIISMLKTFIDEFIEINKTEDISKIADKFIEILPSKYEEIKKEFIPETPEAIPSKGDDGINPKLLEIADNVIQNVFEAMMEGIAPDGTQYSIYLNDEQKSAILNALKTESYAFAEVYDGGEASFGFALMLHLQSYMNESEQGAMLGEQASWESLLGNFGEYLTINQIKKLHSQAGSFLTTATNNGINIEI